MIESGAQNVLLISDLHLEDKRPDITASLFDFLCTTATDAASLYILGDLFEAWIGDDAPDALADRVAEVLLALSSRGVQIFLMHGNRDFLLGQDYATRCGARLVVEPVLIEVATSRIALLHGDVLCTDDTAYQAFRRQVRDPAWQRAFLSRPLPERQAFARQAREQSRLATAGQMSEIMDVTEQAVSELCRQLQLDTLIHGHTHRPAVHRVASSPADLDRPRQRVVLGDWDKQGWFARIDQRGAVTLHSFPLSRG
jgi:UDP-2,3-diacylglucosamine hydrolase